jgi:hypothetical protein
MTEGMGISVTAVGQTFGIAAPMARSNQRRWFDFMGGFHIMDLQTREESSHPMLVGFALLALIGKVTDLVLLPMRRRSR